MCNEFSVGRSLWSWALALGAAATAVGCGGGGGSPGSGNATIVHLKTESVVPGVTGIAYEQLFEADVPHAPGLFLVTGGSLPPGLTLDKQAGRRATRARRASSTSSSAPETARTRRSRSIATRTSPRTARTSC